jgi:regulator of protease activity HflC (stomatin/prohibitin superfamily)
MNVSAIINYVIVDPAKAKFAVEDLTAFIHNQAQEVVRNVCS